MLKNYLFLTFLKVLPRRTDWLGHEHEQSFAELVSVKITHIHILYKQNF